MADTTNIALRDSMVRHQIQLQRFAAGVTKQITDILNAVEDELAAEVRAILGATAGLAALADVRRMNALLNSLTTMRQSTIDELSSTWTSQLEALAVAEPNFLAHQLDTTSPVILDLALPAIETLRAMVGTSPFEGQTLAEWAQSLAADDIRRMESQIRLGMTAGEDSATIARRLVGSADTLGGDGSFQITRNQAKAITRTAVNHISNRARVAMTDLNGDVIGKEVFTAVLDDRTTIICGDEDGNEYDVGEGPIPPLHWNCRSMRVPTLDGTVLGNRPVKNATEQEVDRAFAAANDIPVSKRANLPRGYKGKYDEFSRKYINDRTGTVPATTTYTDWLKSQSDQFQNDILGATKGQLFRDGGLTLSKFIAADGSELNLSELAAKQASAFRAAGLDPGDFK